MHLYQTPQDILGLFSFWALLIFITGSVSALLVRIFQPFLLRKLLKRKRLES